MHLKENIRKPYVKYKLNFLVSGTFYLKQVSLQYQRNHICGATILNENWALTAAGCINGFDNKKLKKKNTMALRINKLVRVSTYSRRFTLVPWIWSPEELFTTHPRSLFMRTTLFSLKFTTISPSSEYLI